MINDEEIVALFFARSEQALRELDSKYGALCRQLSQRILADQRDAEECVNDAYLCVWNAIPPERPTFLRAYLCKIVRNLSLKRCEMLSAAKRDSRGDLPLTELADCLSAPGRVDEGPEADALTCALTGFLDTLSRENRVIFLRRYWFSDSCEQIARQVGLSAKNVSVRLTRLRKQLKQYLTERDVLP